MVPHDDLYLHPPSSSSSPPARGSPRNLRVSGETASSLRVSWAAAPGNVLQYRLAFRPVGSSDRKDRREVSVKGEHTAAVLKKLRPGTEYEVSVRARYPSGLGDALDGRGTTLDGRALLLTLAVSRSADSDPTRSHRHNLGQHPSTKRNHS